MTRRRIALSLTMRDAFAAMSSKNAASLSSATFTASTMPAMRSRRSSVSRKSRSLMTANGGTNVPAKFFLPNRLMLFFTPTPESACASTVVGMRIDADATVRDRRRERRHVEHGAAADDHHERLAIEAGVVDHLHQRQRVRDVVLDRFPARHDHRRPGQLDRRGVLRGVAEHRILQVGIGGRDVIVDDDEQAMPARRLEPRHDRRRAADCADRTHPS